MGGRSAQPIVVRLSLGRRCRSTTDVRIRAVRRGLGLSQAQFAARVGAARKAVVYQWEARKRCPSPVFWQRIDTLCRTDDAG